MAGEQRVLVVVAPDSHWASKVAELGAAGYRVAAFESASALLQAAVEAAPHLFLLDACRADVADGTLPSRLHHLAGLADTPIVLLGSPSSDGRPGEEDDVVCDHSTSQELVGRVRRAIHRRSLRARLRESDERFRRLVEHLPDGLVLVGEAGRIQYANPSAAELFGLPTDHLVGEPFGLPIESASRVEVDLIRAGRPPAPVEMTVMPSEFLGERGWMVSLRDARPERELEAARRAAM